DRTMLPNNRINSDWQFRCATLAAGYAERWPRSETSAFGEHVFPCFPKGSSPTRGRERRPDYTLASRPTRGSGNGLGFKTKWIKRKKWTGALLPDLRPGFLVLLEGIHFHPTLEDGNAIDRVAGVDEFLNQVGERSFEEAAGFVEALFLVLAHRLAVALDEGFDAVLRKHRHPDELGMRLVRRQVLADFDHAILLLRHDVAEQIAFSRRVLEHDQVRIEVDRRPSPLLLVMPGQVHHQRDVRRALEEFLQHRCFENDVAVQNDRPALHLVLGAEERIEFAGLFVSIV